MDSNNVTFFLAAHSDKFPAETLPVIKKRLEELDDQRMLLVNAQEYRSPVLLLVVSLLVGTLGIDRFLIGQIGLGAAKLLTCGGLGFWTVVDWFIIMDATKESNFEKFTRATL